MVRNKSLSTLSLVQVLAFVGLLLAIYFTYSFAKVALVGYQLRQTKEKLREEVAALQAEVAELEATKTYVQTDEYIEQAAREEFKMSRPGDQVVVPLFPSGGNSTTGGSSTAQSSAGEITQPAPVRVDSPWQAWWALFFAQ